MTSSRSTSDSGYGEHFARVVAHVRSLPASERGAVDNRRSVGVDSVPTTKSSPAPLPTTGGHGSQETRS